MLTLNVQCYSTITVTTSVSVLLFLLSVSSYSYCYCECYCTVIVTVTVSVLLILLSVLLYCYSSCQWSRTLSLLVVVYCYRQRSRNVTVGGRVLLLSVVLYCYCNGRVPVTVPVLYYFLFLVFFTICRSVSVRAYTAFTSTRFECSIYMFCTYYTHQYQVQNFPAEMKDLIAASINYTNKTWGCWRAWESFNICTDIPIRRVFFFCLSASSQ